MDIYQPKILICAGIFVFGAFLIFSLLVRKGKIPTSNFFLSGFIFVICYFAINFACMISGSLRNYPHFIMTWYPLNLLLGPLTYGYFRSLTLPNFKLHGRDFVHVMPAVIGAILLVPFYASDPQSKIDFLYLPQLGVNCQPYAVSVVTLASFYFFLCIGELRRFQNSLEDNFSCLDAFKLKWLRLFFVLQMIPWVNAVLAILFNEKHLIGTTLPLAVFLLLGGIGYFAMYQSNICNLTDGKIKLFIREDAEPHKDQSEEQKKYYSSRLGDQELERLTSLTIQLIENEKIYLKNDLKLQDLAKLVDVTEYQLSQAINVGLKQNFYDLINRYRIQEAQRLLKDPAHSHETIIAVAMDSGFNSKSVFNTAFKRITGLTPSEFRAS